MSDTSDRAKAARDKILSSGNPDLINRLHLLEATGKDPARVPPSAGTGLFGLGMAAFGGAYLGNLLAGWDITDEMSEAFAVVADDLGLEGAEDTSAGGGLGDIGEDDGGFGLF
ncbi:hypothetical protein [Roseicitreum antarcticum]|uniref:Uncharacterized protein n=1 Tax=Roseicitreum antarcticum TaxID=564137 RepID=A0A1H2VQ17_9RHOB|nr:hypothetical protein [Roseicitreum antarcticum]SDW70413.1 hypothetical protein SAMN04488238_103139 [Roseicitreum antarcticum]